MRYPPDQKAKAKQAILQAGAKALKTHGFHGIGVDGLAAAANVTSGAFYSNFSNKEELLKEVIAAYVGQPFIGPDGGNHAGLRDRLKSFLKMYLSCEHRDGPADGCVMPALSADVSRSSLAVREAYQRNMKALIGKMSEALESPADDGEKKAWTIVALMVGAISVARALPDADEANKIIDAVLESTISLIEKK